MSTSTPTSSRDLAMPSLPQVESNDNAVGGGTVCRSSACCGGLGGWFGVEMLSAMAVSMLLFVVACGSHVLVVRSGFVADTAWFAMSGVAFLLLTAASHGVLCQQSDAAPLVPLMISMAIRLTGTFLILGIILKLSPLSRPEAVFNVLFWYITLTVTDLVGVVRHKNRDNHVASVVAGKVSAGDRA